MKTMLFLLCFAMYTSASIAEESINIDMRELVPLICNITHGSLEVTNLEVKQTRDEIQNWAGVASFEIGVNKERYNEGIERIVKYFESKGIESSIQKFTLDSNSRRFQNNASGIETMFDSINSNDHINLIFVRDLSYRQRDQTPEELEYNYGWGLDNDGKVHELEANAYVYSFDKSLRIDDGLMNYFRAWLLILGEQGNPMIEPQRGSSFNTIVATCETLEDTEEMMHESGNNFSIFPILSMPSGDNRYYKSNLDWKTGKWHVNNVYLGKRWLAGNGFHVKLGAKNAAIVLVPNGIEEHPDYLKINESNVFPISQ